MELKYIYKYTYFFLIKLFFFVFINPLTNYLSPSFFYRKHH